MVPVAEQMRKLVLSFHENKSSCVYHFEYRTLAEENMRILVWICLESSYEYVSNKLGYLFATRKGIAVSLYAPSLKHETDWHHDLLQMFEICSPPAGIICLIFISKLF